MKKLTLILGLLILGACSPKKSSIKSSVTTSATTNNVNSVNCGVNTGSNSLGTIYGQQGTGTYGTQFENQVKALLSANVSPSEVGSISSGWSDSTGVRFSGRIKLDGNGNVVGAQSKLLISVYDSIWLMRKMSNPSEVEIQISFDPSSSTTMSGQFNMQTGEGYFSAKDQYGEVRLEGRMDAQNFSGVVKFQNATSVIGGSPAAGQLGQFFITRCGIIQ